MLWSTNNRKIYKYKTSIQKIYNIKQTWYHNYEKKEKKSQNTTNCPITADIILFSA